MVDRRRGSLLILAAAALWGTTGTAQELGPDGSDPLGVGLMRLVVAAPVLLLLAVARHRPVRWSVLARGPLLVAAAGMAVYQPAFFTAVDRTGVAVGTVVAIGSAPILTGLLGWVVEGVRPVRVWWVATMLAVSGVTVLALTGNGASVDVVGVLLAVVAGAGYAVYALASKRLVAGAPAAVAMAAVFLIATVVLLPALPVLDLDWLASTGGVAMTIHLGVIATAVAYVLFATGLRATGAATAVTVTLAEPLTATVLGVAVLAERPGPAAWAGAALLAAGLVLVMVAGSHLGRPAHGGSRLEI